MSSAGAAETLKEIEWSEVASPGVQQIHDEAFAEEVVLKVSAAEGTVVNELILRDENPGVKRSTYALVGQIRYEGVSQPGYVVELLWNNNRVPGVQGHAGQAA